MADFRNVIVATVMIISLSSCARPDRFKGTWTASSTSPTSSIAKLVIDDSLVREVTVSGGQTVMPYHVVSEREAVAQGALGASIDLQLTGPDTLHMNDPESTYQRS